MLVVSQAEKHLRILKQNLIAEAADELNGKICHRNRFSISSLFGQIRTDINSPELQGFENKWMTKIEKWMTLYIENTTTFDLPLVSKIIVLASTTILTIDLSRRLCDLLDV